MSILQFCGLGFNLPCHWQGNEFVVVVLAIFLVFPTSSLNFSLGTTTSLDPFGYNWLSDSVCGALLRILVQLLISWVVAGCFYYLRDK